MLKCEIFYNIPAQKIELYLGTKDLSYIYNGEKFEAERTNPATTRKPSMTFYPEDFDAIADAVIEYKNKYKPEDSSSVQAQKENLEDLRWVLRHFMDKDK